MRKINLALNICTYHRKEYVQTNISKLKASLFFSDSDSKYFGQMQVFIVDNASESPEFDNTFWHFRNNKNTGGAGGFQRGLEEIRKCPADFSHVIFMDDDVEFEVESFYILYDFLCTVEEEYAQNPVAGRMFCSDHPNVQYTAGEIWNRGKIRHVEYMRHITPENYHYGRVNYDSGAEYGGWWFCCFPMSFVKNNDILPFFLHCDDVEYGLRCGKKPIIIEGVQVWHETFEKRLTPLIRYYDTRNPLYVNEIHNLAPHPLSILKEWKDRISDLHAQRNWLSEFYVILAMNDFLKGLDWLKSIDSEKYHKKLKRKRSCRLKNAIAWRLVERKFRNKYNV